MNKTLSETFKDFLGERRTSPMYQTFIISWCLWNWNFLYTLFFEDGKLILEKTNLLKHEYLKTLHDLNRHIDWSIFLSKQFINYTFGDQSGLRNHVHLYLGPILSIYLFFFVFNQPEIRFRNRANKNKNKQIDSDKIVKDKETELKKSVGKEFDVEIENRKKAMELEKAELKAELDKKKIEIELEKEELKAELDKKNKELELEKTNKQIQDNNEISSLKQRDLEYEEASTIEDFFQSIEGLKILAGETDKGTEDDVMIKFGYLYTTYNLYNKGSYEDYNTYHTGSLTEKGKYFLRKALTKGDLKNKTISGGNIYKASSNGEIEDDLPF